MQLDTEDEPFAIGANALISAGNMPVLLSPAFTYFIQGEFTEFQIDANVLYPLDLEGDPQLEPFFAGGLVIEHFSYDDELGGFSETKAGLNVAAGAHLRVDGNFKPYIQGQYSIINDWFNRFLVTVGVQFDIQKSN